MQWTWLVSSSWTLNTICSNSGWTKSSNLSPRRQKSTVKADVTLTIKVLILLSRLDSVWRCAYLVWQRSGLTNNVMIFLLDCFCSVFSFVCLLVFLLQSLCIVKFSGHSFKTDDESANSFHFPAYFFCFSNIKTFQWSTCITDTHVRSVTY